MYACAWGIYVCEYVSMYMCGYYMASNDSKYMYVCVCVCFTGFMRKDSSALSLPKLLSVIIVPSFVILGS